MSDDPQQERGDSRSAQVSSADELAALDFSLRSTWRNVLPDDPPTNALVLRRLDFDADLFTPYANHFERTTVRGSGVDATTTGGTATVENHGDVACEERFVVNGELPGPHFSTVLRVSSWSAPPENGRHSDPQVGIRADEDNWVAVRAEPPTEEIAVTSCIDGQEDEVRDSGLPTPPFDLLAMWMGGQVCVFTRAPGSGWAFRTTAEWDHDHYADGEWRRWRAWWGASLSPGESASAARLSLLQTPQFGVRDPTVVTRPDGTPFLDGRRVYLLCSGGAPGRGYSYQCVFKLHVDTYELEFAGVLYADTAGDSCYPDNAAHAVYDEDADDLIVLFSGFGSRHLGPDEEVTVYVARAGREVLEGVHTLSATDANLPTESSAWDPFLVYDDGAEAWRCAYAYDGAGTLAVAETTDDSLADGWSTVHVRPGPNEGTKLVPVEGGYVCTYTNVALPTDVAVSDYPRIGENESELSVDVAPQRGPEGGFSTHPMIFPLPTDGGTRYLHVGFDGSEIEGLDPRTRGGLWIYEAEYEPE